MCEIKFLTGHKLDLQNIATPPYGIIFYIF